jgi:hypothetical protein
MIKLILLQFVASGTTTVAYHIYGMNNRYS